MRAPIILFVLILFTSFQSLSQDIITLKNNSTIDAKNIIIDTDIVKYQNYYAENGEVLILKKSEVVSILYQNGSKASVYEPTVTVVKSSIGDNLITFHFLDFVISNFTVSYERIIADGKYGIQIPFSFGYANNPRTIYFPTPMGDIDDGYTNNLTNQFYTGVTFNIYPMRQGKVKYFLGPSLRFGSGKYFEYFDNYGQNTSYNIKTGYIKFFVNNGIIFTFVNSLSISVIGSIGIQHMYKVDNNATQTTGALSVNMSYRF